MADKPDKLPPDISSPAEPAQDRRRTGQAGKAPRVDPKAIGGVSHDDQGNAVWQWRVDVPRRRDDDPTIDLLDCLDVDGMSLEEDEARESPEPESFNPYDKTR